MGILDKIRKKRSEKKESKKESITRETLPPTRITGPKDTGGVITGTNRDIVTNSGGSSGGGGGSSSKTATVTQTDIPPKTVDPVKSVDFSDASGKRTSSETIRGNRGFGAGNFDEKGGFTGKVERISPETGEADDTEFFYGGKEVGRISRGPRGNFYSPSVDNGFEKAIFGFDNSGGRQEVELTPNTAQVIDYIRFRQAPPVTRTSSVQPKESFGKVAFDIVGGERGKRLTGVTLPYQNGIRGILPGQLPTVTFEEIGSFAAEKGGAVGGAFDILLPKTPGGIALTVAPIGIYGKLPKIARISGNVVTGGLGTKGAFDPSKSNAERIASGVIAIGGFAGTYFESAGYFRGVTARFSKDYAPIKTSKQGFEFIRSKDYDIGLILEKSPLRTGQTANIKLPPTSPLKRGGFEVKQSEKKIFLKGGEKQFLTTSQQSFFKRGKDITLEREFFTTPEEPTLNIPESRLSRLGLSDLLSFNKNFEVGFGIPKKPQIGVSRGRVGTKENNLQLRIGPGTELEAISSPGRILTNIQRRGKTVIRGQGVDIYSFDLGPLGKNNILTPPPSVGSSRTYLRVSGEGAITTALTGRSSTLPNSNPLRSGNSFSPGKFSNTYFVTDFSSQPPLLPKSPPSSPRPYRNFTNVLSPTNSLTNPLKTIPDPTPPRRKKEDFGLVEFSSSAKGQRSFKFAPSFGAVLGKELGFNLASSREGSASRSGLVEREFRKGINLPTTFLKKVSMKNMI